MSPIASIASLFPLITLQPTNTILQRTRIRTYHAQRRKKRSKNARSCVRIPLHLLLSGFSSVPHLQVVKRTTFTALTSAMAKRISNTQIYSGSSPQLECPHDKQEYLFGLLSIYYLFNLDCLCCICNLRRKITGLV